MTYFNNIANNADMISYAKNILSKENYQKFIYSYKFTFWLQLIGMLAGFIIPTIIFLLIYKNFIYCIFAVSIGIFWMCIWLPVSLLFPQTKIYRRFSKMFRNNKINSDELNSIFKN